MSIFTKTFYRCQKIKSINLCNITSIGPYAFDSCLSLTPVAVKNGTKYIDTCAFRNSESPQYLGIGGFCFVNESAFEGCRNLITIVLKDQCQISYNAFLRCTSISSLVTFDNVFINESSFDDSLQNQIDIYYLGSNSVYSSNLEKYVKDVTVFNSYTDNFFFKTPTKLTEEEMIEKIKSINNGTYYYACEIYVPPPPPKRKSN